MDFPIVLENTLFPVQAFFNSMPERSLITALESFRQGIGAGFNEAVCEFPDELEEGDEPFSGVRFYIFDEEITITNKQFMNIISDVCSIYLEKKPEKVEQIKLLLNQLEKKLSD